MKIYVVCEKYTCAFEGIFPNIEDAKEREKEVGGYILEYDTDNKVNSQGEWEDIDLQEKRGLEKVLFFHYDTLSLQCSGVPGHFTEIK